MTKLVDLIIAKLYRDQSANNSSINRLIGAIVWNVMGLVAGRGITMISAILVARILGAGDFGQFGMLNSTITMFATFAGLGLGLTSTKFVAEFKVRDKKKAGRVLGLTNGVALLSGIFMTILIYSVSDWLAISQLNNYDMSKYLKIASVMLLFNTFNGVQRGALSGYEQFPTLAKCDTVIGLMSFIGNLTGTYYYGLQGLIISNTAISFAACLICSNSLTKINNRNNIVVDYSGIRKERKILFSVSIPSMLNGVMVGPVIWVCNTMLINSQNGYAELGLFNAADQWRTLLQLLPQIFNSAILPILIAQKEDMQLGKINILASWIFVTACAFPILMLPEMIANLYGEGYDLQEFKIVLVIMVFSCIILAYKEGIARNLVSQNMLWWSVLSNLIWALAMVGVQIYLYQFGAIGLAAAYLSAYFITFVIFIPFYIGRGVVPRNLIVSKEVLLIWVLICIQLFLSILEINIFFRILIGVVDAVAIGLLIRNILIEKEVFYELGDLNN